MKKRKINSVAFPCTRALETHTTARQSDEHYSKVGLDTGPVAWEKKYLNSEGKGFKQQFAIANVATIRGVFCLVLFAISASHCPFGSTKRRV